MIVPAFDQVTSIKGTVVRFADGLECQCAIGGLWWRNLGHEPADGFQAATPTPGIPHTPAQRRERAQSLRRTILDLVDLPDAREVIVAGSRQQALEATTRLAEHNHLRPVVIRRDALPAGTRRSVPSADHEPIGEPGGSAPATISDETWSGFRHRKQWFATTIDNRPVDAVLVGPGVSNGRFGTCYVVVGPRLGAMPNDLVRYDPDDAEYQTVPAVGTQFNSPRLREDSDRNARLLSRGVQTLVDQQRLHPTVPRPLADTSDWDHVLRLPADGPSPRFPAKRLGPLLEQLRQDHVWVAGVEPDKILIMPAITSNEADVARILDAVHAALR